MESDDSENQNKIDHQLPYFAKKSHENTLRNEKSPILSKRDDESVATSSVIQTESIISDIKPVSEYDSVSEKQTPSLQDYSKKSPILKDKSESNSIAVAEDEVINEFKNNVAEEVTTNSSHFSIPSLNLNSLSQSLSEADKIHPSEKTGNSERKSPTELPESSVPSYKSDVNIESLLQTISDTTQENKANSINKISLVSQVIDDDHLSIDSSIHTHLDESVKSSEGNLSVSNADIENVDISVPVDNDSISGSQNKSNSLLYLEEESAIDPPLQLNTDPPETNNPDENSSSSEEIIKLDIRGDAIVKRNFPFSNILFSNVDSILTPINRNNFITLNALPSFDGNRELEGIKVQKNATVLESEEILDEKEMYPSINGSDVMMADNDDSKSGNGDYEQDFDIEEMILNQSREVFVTKDTQDNDLFDVQNKPTAEGEFSLSTVTTDYKTFHEDFKHKIPDIQKFLLQKIEELRSSLQQSAEQRDSLQLQNDHLVSEISKLQQLLSDISSSGLEIKGQLSDFAKHENFIKEDSLDYITQSEGLTKKAETADVQASVLNPEAPKGTSNIFNRHLDNLDDSFNTYCLNLDFTNSENVRNNVLNFLEKEFLSNFEKTINGVNDQLNKSNNTDAGIKMTLNEVLFHMKPENHELIEFFKVVEQKHQREVEKLRTYFEERCAKMEKNYSEEIFSQHSKKLSADSSMDSLDNCPEALPFGSPMHGAGDKGYDLPDFKIRRSHSAEFHLGLDEVSVLQKKIFNMIKEHQTQLKVLTTQHEMDFNDLRASHELHFNEMEENYKNQIAELKAHLQTLENTDHGDFLHFEHRDTDLELEKALLSDPHAGLSNWPLEFIGLRDKVQAEMQQTIESLKVAHANELSAVQSDSSQQLALITDKYKVEADKWKQKRNDAFDKNRKLEEAIKERDGLKRMTTTLQKVLSQLVEYFNLCEDELNNTFVGELLRQIIDADDNFDNTIILSSFTTDKDTDLDHEFRENLDNSALSQISRHSKRMHFAPKVDGILPFIETESILDCLDKSQDVSVNFKHDLDYCLRRLKQEAQELLVLSSQAPKRLSILGSNDEQKPTKDYASADELLQEHNDLQDKYDKSEAVRKDLEESLAQSMYREEMLKGDLQVALERFAELANDHPLHQDVISDRYGAASPPGRLAAELQVATTEREDMQMRLEAANKQLRSTRQFLEEQAAEREHERDEFQQELKQLKDENSKLLVKTQQYVRISKEVDQLETQIKDMTNRISELESENSTKLSELAASEEKVGLLRDIIGNLENQLETKMSQEVEVLKDLEYFRLLSEEREMKIENLTDELKVSRNDMEKQITEGLLSANSKKTQNTNVEKDNEKLQIEQMRNELQILLKTLAEHTAALESLHEAVCSQSCSSPSEDVSIRDHKKQQTEGAPSPLSVRGGRLPILEVSQLGDGLQRHLRAEDAALKRIRDLEMQLVQLKDVAQELRMERDVLQERMSEQSLRISSLQSRLEQTRHTVEAQSYHSTEGLRRQLDQALADGQLLREGLRSRDMQLRALEGTPDSSKEMIQRLRRELEENKSKCRELQKEVEISHQQQEALLADKNADIVVLRQQLLEKEKHLQAVLSLQIEDEREKDCNNDGKLSARTLSDILSISEFDEPDLVLRNAELRPQSFVSGQFIFSTNDTKEQTLTVLPESGHIIPVTASSVFGITNQSPKDTSPAVQKEHSLPTLHRTTLTSPVKQENLSPANFKMLSDNCSMFPNKDASGDKNVTIQPKKIDFSVSNLSELNKIDRSAVKKANLSLNDADIYKDVEINFPKNLSNLQIPKSLKDLGIHVDTQQKVYPDILTQLKNEIRLLREELNAKTTALKMAEEQLSEFPAVKDEMEELERVLQNSLETMEEDKKYFNIQLDNFAKGEQVLKEKLENATSEVNEKSKEVDILKDDILRRETMISEIYKEKRSVELKLSQTEERCHKFESDSVENHNLKKKLIELQKLENTIAEKNLQIDSLNENLDRLDDLQKRIIEEENQNKKLTFNLIEKNAEVTQLQTKCQDLKYAEEQLIIENSTLTIEINLLTGKNDELQNVLSKYEGAVSKLENDLENVIQTQNVKQTEQSSGETNEDIIKLEEYKWLLSGLDGQRSPVEKIEDDHYQLKFNTIRSKVQTLQSDLISKRKELSAKVLQLEKAKLEIGDLQKQVEYLQNDESDKDRMLKELVSERLNLRANLKILRNQLNEEGNLEELRDKLNKRTEECDELQSIVIKLTDAAKKHEADSLLSVERDRHLQELLLENERLKQALDNVKKMLIEREIKFNNILTNVESQKLENLLHKDTQTSLLLEIDHHVSQNQDSDVIRILKEQLESAIDSETELQAMLEREKSITDHLEMQVKTLKRQVEQLNETLANAESSNSSAKVKKEKNDRATVQLEDQVLISESLKSEMMSLRTQLDNEKAQFANLQNISDREKHNVNKTMEEYKHLIAELQKNNHELHLKMVHSSEMLHLKKNENANLEKKLSKILHSQRRLENAETYEALLELENLLRRNINENIQMSETVRELTLERRELQAKVKVLENQIKMGGKYSQSLANLPEGLDQQVRFLYGRYMRVDSYRKALVWQKRYLMEVANASYLLQHWRNPSTTPTTNRFKCVTLSIIAVFRMKYLVRRWHTGNRIGANIHLNIPNVYPTELRNSKSYSHLPTSSYVREKSEMQKANSSLDELKSVNRTSAKPSNKNWTVNSRSNVSGRNQDEGLNSQNPHHHNKMHSFLEEAVPHKLKSCAQPYDTSERYHSTIDNSRLQEHLPESQDAYGIKYLNNQSRNEVSPIVSKYLEKISQLDAKLQRALKSPRDPP